MEVAQGSSSEFFAVDTTISSSHATLPGAETCLRETIDYALNQLSKHRMRSSEETVVFIYPLRKDRLEDTLKAFL